MADSNSTSAPGARMLSSITKRPRDLKCNLQENSCYMTRQMTSTSVFENKRRIFWRNVVKQFNFTDHSERELLLSLTEGVCWLNMRVLPRDFICRHREIYYLISTPYYERSGSIGRDVTRTFSIFERSHQHQLAAQQSALFRVLNAIAEAEDGYCQGMNFIAALFLVEELSEADAYALFLYMLKNRHLAGIYHRSSMFLDEYLQHFDQMFIKELPTLHLHLLEQGFVVPMYGIEWFTTLFSLSTKTDLACAIFDLFFVGIKDIFLRTGLSILKLLEPKLMCMTAEDFLQDFKLLVREVDPYQVIMQALTFRPNHNMHDEDTIAYVSREHFLRKIGTPDSSCIGTSAISSERKSADGNEKTFMGIFGLHRTLPPALVDAIGSGNGSLVRQIWEDHVTSRHHSATASIVLANEILHVAIWYGRVSIACLAIGHCNADVDNRDDAGLTPLHFSVIRNQPDMVRLLLANGASMQKTGMQKISPLELAYRWKRCDTTAARLVLEKEVCLYCNSKFDVLDLETEHQCPNGSRVRGIGIDRLLSESTVATLGNYNEGLETIDDDEIHLGRYKDRSRGSSTSSTAISCASTFSVVGSGVTLSRSMSDSSSLECSTSPAFFMDSPTAMSWLGSPRFDDTSLNFVDLALSDQDSDTTEAHCTGQVSNRLAWQATYPLLEFPDRPEWYCNARECHFVFALFSQADKCLRCDGYFCSDHVNGQTKYCSECQRDLCYLPQRCDQVNTNCNQDHKSKFL